MAENKKGFILYADQKELFDQLPDDKAGELIKHIFSYVNDEEPQTEDLLLKLAFTPIKQQLKRDLKKFEEVREKRRAAGKASAESRKQKAANSTSVKSVQQTSTKSTVKDNVNVNDKVNVTVKVKDIKTRESEFKNSLLPFLDDYGKDLITKFFNYWSESNPNGKKMKFEMQKTFDTKKRLITWKNKQNEFSNNKPNFNNGKSSPGNKKTTNADKLENWARGGNS